MNDADYKALDARVASLENSQKHIIAASKLIVDSIRSVIKASSEMNATINEIAELVGLDLDE